MFFLGSRKRTASSSVLVLEYDERTGFFGKTANQAWVFGIGDWEFGAARKRKKKGMGIAPSYLPTGDGKGNGFITRRTKVTTSRRRKVHYSDEDARPSGWGWE